MADQSRITDRLRYERAAAGLTQDEAAKLLGIAPMTVSKRERGALGISAEEFERVIAAYRAHRNSPAYHVSQSAPRGTAVLRESMAIPYHPLGAKFESFSREMIRAGATDEEVDWLTDLLRRPETGRLIAVGKDGAPLSDRAVEEQWDALLDDFRNLIYRRVARREGRELVPQPIVVSARAFTPEERARMAEETRRADAAERAQHAAVPPRGKRGGRGR